MLLGALRGRNVCLVIRRSAKVECYDNFNKENFLQYSKAGMYGFFFFVVVSSEPVTVSSDVVTLEFSVSGQRKGQEYCP